MTTTTPTFDVALTADFFGTGGQPLYADIGLDVLSEHPRIHWRALATNEPELQPEQIGAANAILVLAPRVTARSLVNARDLLALARFGVGYDSVDVAACTAADVALTIAAGAVDRPMAEATVAWMLALTHHVRVKDQLVRTGRWSERSGFMGSELRDRTLGVIGYGGIGRALVRLLGSFGMKEPLAFDPFLDASVTRKHGARPVSLEELLSQSDFVSVHCPLNAHTRGLIGAPQLARMRATAYLLNTARGGIVDEDALFAALAERRIAGAALDVFADEPVTQPHRFGQLDNVLLAPHCIGWTHELFRDIGRTACRSLVDLAHGRPPHGLVNPDVIDRPGFRKKWARLQIAAR